jgi:hypothetical protein
VKAIPRSVRVRAAAVALGMAAAWIVTAARAGEADWFTQNGFTVMEAVGSPELGWVVVGTDETGTFRMLGRGDSFRDRFRIDAIGAEQVKVTSKEKGTTVAPILHRNLPTDVFLVALATVYQRSIVVGARVETLKPFSPDLLTDPARLADFCKEEGLDLRVLDDCMLVRKGTFPADLKPYTSTEPQLAIGMGVLRGTQAEVGAEIARVSGKVVTPVGTPSSVLSVKSFGLSPQALAYYVEKTVDAGFKIEEPKPAQPPVAARRAAAPAARASSARAGANARLKQLIQQGKYLPAARLARSLIKREPTRAGYYNAFGISVWKLGHRGLAVRAWEKALRMDPASAYARKALARARGVLARDATATATAAAGTGTAASAASRPAPAPAATAVQ